MICAGHSLLQLCIVYKSKSCTWVVSWWRESTRSVPLVEKWGNLLLVGTWGNLSCRVMTRKLCSKDREWYEFFALGIFLLNKLVHLLTRNYEIIFVGPGLQSIFVSGDHSLRRNSTHTFSIRMRCSFFRPGSGSRFFFCLNVYFVHTAICCSIFTTTSCFPHTV